MLGLPILLARCLADETVSGHAQRDTAYRLVEIAGAPAAFAAHLSLVGPGRVTGTSPCGAFAARQTVPYPWFRIEDLERPACTDAAGLGFLAALERMTLAEASGPVLILSNDAGETLVFRAGPD